jgi:hypothetical protein
MAAAGLAELLGASPEQVCVAAEIGYGRPCGEKSTNRIKIQKSQAT